MKTKVAPTNRLLEVDEAEEAIPSGGDVMRTSVMKPEIMTFKITGLSPLLQNNPAEFIGKNEDTGIVHGKKVYDDEQEAKLRVYKDDEGNFTHPSEAFIKAMVRAVSGMKLNKKSANAVIRGTVFIAEPACIILDGTGKPAKKYQIDRRPVVIGKARILRCRPVWMPWKMNLALDVDAGLIQRKVIVECLSLAGRVIGIGDYRPEKGGGFGRFKVE